MAAYRLAREYSLRPRNLFAGMPRAFQPSLNCASETPQ